MLHFYALWLLVACQDPQPKSKVDQKQVDEAIRAGIEYLKKESPGRHHQDPRGSEMSYDELVLWTYVHAGVPQNEEPFKSLFEKVLNNKEEHTYIVALKAMILEEVERVKYQNHIARCAQFLVDNLSEDGQWSYGEPSPHANDIPTGGRGDVASGSKNPTTGGKPTVKRKIGIKQRRKGPKQGDNSNSQYAALGIRACADAGIVFEPALLRRAKKSWEDLLQKDGGWNYGGGGMMMEKESYGSMTAGGVGSLVIYKHLLGEKWKDDRRVLSGLKWLDTNFSVRTNPGKGNGGARGWYYYYLYALERAGILYGTETLGKHEWYPEGANELLNRQRDDGSWGPGPRGGRGGGGMGPPNGPGGGGQDIPDTCFAILFLRRATRPLDVASVDNGKK